MINIFIIGKIIVGLLIFVIENIEDIFFLLLDFVKYNKEFFILCVLGESMIEVGINNNDLVIIESFNSVMNGDIVVVLIEDFVIIKRFFKEKDYIRFQLENSIMELIIVDNCFILGKLVGIFRLY